MRKLKETADDEGLLTSNADEFEALMEKFKPSKDRDLELYKSEIIEILEDELVGRYFYAKGRLAHSLEKDNFIKQAVEILNDSGRYNSILNIQ